MYSAGHWKTRHRYAAVCGGKKMRNEKVDLISVSFFKKKLQVNAFPHCNDVIDMRISFWFSEGPPTFHSVTFEGEKI